MARKKFADKSENCLTVSNLYSMVHESLAICLSESLDDNRKRLLGLEIGHDFMDMQ